MNFKIGQISSFTHTKYTPKGNWCKFVETFCSSYSFPSTPGPPHLFVSFCVLSWTSVQGLIHHFGQNQCLWTSRSNTGPVLLLVNKTPVSSVASKSIVFQSSVFAVPTEQRCSCIRPALPPMQDLAGKRFFLLSISWSGIKWALDWVVDINNSFCFFGVVFIRYQISRDELGFPPQIRITNDDLSGRIDWGGSRSRLT